MALRSPRWAVGALVAGVLLVGCSEPDEPGTITRTTPTPTTSSPSPTPTTPEAQVEAAVRTYYAEFQQATRTNDASQLKRLLDEACPCYNAVRIIEKNVTEKETTPDVEFSLESVRVHDVFGKTAAAEVRFHVSEYDVLDEDGKVVAHIKEQSNHLDLSLVRSDSRWIVANLFDLEG